MAAGRQYSAVYTSSTSAGSGVAFGFGATFVKVTGDAGINYILFSSTSGAATTDYKLAATETFQFTAAKGTYSGLAVTTSSGTATLRILALS